MIQEMDHLMRQLSPIRSLEEELASAEDFKRKENANLIPSPRLQEESSPEKDNTKSNPAKKKKGV